MKHPPLPLTVATAMLAISASQSPLAADHDEDEIPFDIAKVFFQLNDTDGDLGIHAIIDGDPWKRLQIEGPNERRLLDIRTRSRLRMQGLTELRFESAEPTFDELPPEVFFRRFPPGEYEVEGMTLEGEELEGTAVITHVLPAPPENLAVSGMPAPEDCDTGPVPVVAEGAQLVVSWDPVTTSHPEIGESGPIEITRYEVAIEREDPPLELTADIPPNFTSFSVPPELVAAGQELKYQILATDVGGNETSSESCLEIE